MASWVGTLGADLCLYDAEGRERLTEAVARQQAEEARQRAEQALQDSESQLALLRRLLQEKGIDLPPLSG